MAGGLGAWVVKKVKGRRGANWQVQKSHGDVKPSTGNIDNNTVKSM